MATELLGGKPYTCFTLTLARGKEKIKTKEKEACLFDVSKADQIFDFLVKDRHIKLPKGHKLPPIDQIQNMKYCKWHNSYSHYMNNCTIFRNMIQKVLKEGRFKLADKNGGSMFMDINSFPSATINMVSILAKSKFAKKETSSSQPVQQSK